ncbi:MAG: haloacid dehalogenase type II, partial [Rhodospirillaceae bacterium]|nr:haloacid dehalogenase type II [Rhodospirillaceae bacterium]
MAIKAILFDAYGTLLDVHSSVALHADRLGPVAGAVSALWRQKQLEYTWTLTLAGRYRPFDAVTADALDFALAQHGHAEAGLRQDLLDSYRHLAPFADAGPALTELKAAGMRLGILSNGTLALLREAVASAGIADVLDPLLSVDAIRIYKPDRQVYAMAADSLNLLPGEIGFVSSNAWDAMGAESFGFRVFQLRRQPGPDEYHLAGKTKV